MDILIKSFNRAYYLDRCIRSIYKNVEGQFKIKILDDGTPAEYLHKISSLYPEVLIYKSGEYLRKSQAVIDHVSKKKNYSLSSIPADFWKHHMSQSSEIFLLLEDDMWLTDPIDLRTVQNVMEKNKIIMVRLSWQDNEKLIYGKKIKLEGNLEEIIPSIPLFSKIIFSNKLLIGSVLYKLKLLNPLSEFRTILPYYTFYSIAAAFFKKDYWLYLWSDPQEEVNELRQLKKAKLWFQKNKSRYAKSEKEILKTSYITSTTNHYKDVSLDLMRLNHKLNEAWLKGNLDSLQNFPDDFKVDYLKSFLDAGSDSDTKYEEWMKWIQNFKNQYRRLGCVIE